MTVFSRLLLLICMCIIGSTCDAEQPLSKNLLFLASPEVSSELANARFRFLEMNVRGTLRTDRTLLRTAELTPKEQLKAFSCMVTDGDALVIALVNSPSGGGPVVVYSVGLGASVVNISPILAMKELTPTGQSARIDRALMFAIGMLLQVDSCMNPFCALSEVDHFRKDQLPGRNYCPACTDKVSDQLKNHGVCEGTPLPKSGK